jgi:hypothetical protein
LRFGLTGFNVRALVRVLSRLRRIDARHLFGQLPTPPRPVRTRRAIWFDTGFAFGYFQRQHVGATAWFLMAAQNFNPYQ